MAFRVSHYNFLFGGVFTGVVASWITTDYWLIALAALVGAAANYAWSLWQFRDGDPTVRDYLDSMRKPKSGE
jgi:uncharacterized membrane protein YccC